MTNKEKNLCGTSLTEVDGVSVSVPADQLSHAAPTHTPGPWAWFGNTKMHTLHLATINRGRQFVMTFARWGMGGAQPRFQVNHRMVDAKELVLYERPYRQDVFDINHPDARLIAAAPELLGALRFLVAFDDFDAPVYLDANAWKRAIAQAKHAIAKAEGAQS